MAKMPGKEDVLKIFETEEGREQAALRLVKMLKENLDPEIPDEAAREYVNQDITNLLDLYTDYFKK
ncbi:hypothetical protein AAA450_10240 [Staphylococcus equorum]|uniref:hypothetical protein n=1 Tax=Staphylococcus equorum TaxID=246432 RepID=UPI003D801888